MEMGTEVSSLARKLENAKINDTILTTTSATAEQMVIDVLAASLAKMSGLPATEVAPESELVR